MVEIRADVTANVWEVLVEVGTAVEKGTPIVVLESMKMEIPLLSPADGVIDEICVVAEQIVQEGDLVARLRTARSPST